MRCDEPGWIPIVTNERRGVWYRLSANLLIELCGGREGDDIYVRISSGDVLTKQQWNGLISIIELAAYCADESQ